MIGRIVKILSNDYTVKYNDEIIVCKVRGKFRSLHLTPLVGDFVKFDKDKKYIMEILDRKNELVRPPVSNIDQVIIVTSVKDPDFESNLLDKLLVILEYNKIKPIICFSKLDLLDDTKEIYKYINYYRKYYEVYLNTEVDKIKNVFKNKLTVFTGQSGAGKSTLLNKLNPNLNLKTNEISYALGRGKHTTRHVELLELFDGMVADTPGFSAINFNMNNIEIKDNFIDFDRYREECEFRDCKHIKEENCGIKKHVDSGDILKSRYENYLKFVRGEE